MPDSRPRFDQPIHDGLPKDKVAMEWIADQLLDRLDAGRFATIARQA